MKKENMSVYFPATEIENVSREILKSIFFFIDHMHLHRSEPPGTQTGLKKEGGCRVKEDC